MRRLAGWIGGVVWGFVGYQLWKRWRRAEVAPAPTAEDPDVRAEELRAKLAEARESEEPAPAEPTDQTGEDPASIEERRRRVHDEGRAAIDEMRGPSE